MARERGDNAQAHREAGMRQSEGAGAVGFACVVGSCCCTVFLRACSLCSDLVSHSL